MKVCSSSREMESLPAQETKGIFSQAEIRAQLLLHWHLREVWAKIFNGEKWLNTSLLLKPGSWGCLHVGTLKSVCLSCQSLLTVLLHGLKMCVVRNLVLHLLKPMRKQVLFWGERRLFFWKVALNNFLILQIMVALFIWFLRTGKEREPGSHSSRFSLLIKVLEPNFLGTMVMQEDALVWEHQIF